LGYLSRAEAKARFAPNPSPVAAPGPAPVSAAAYSAKALSVNTAEPLADPRVSDMYQPFGGYTYGPTGELAVAVGVPGTAGEKIGREIWVYTQTGKRLVIGGAGEASWPAWSPDGQKLAYDFRPAGSATSEIWLAAADGTGRRQLSRDSAGSHAYLVWSPDGKRLASVVRDYRTGTAGVSVLNVETGASTALTTSNLESFSDLAWSKDGRKLLLASEVAGVNPRSTLKLIEVAGKTVAELLPKSDRGVNDHPRWSPDGREIAFSSNRSGQRQIWVVRADGANLRQLTTGDEPKDYPTWSADGRILLYLAGRNGLGNLWVSDAGGGEGVQLTSSGRISGRAEWAPDGKRLVFTKREQSQQLWTATLATK
ncbi:MAG: TolB family protein, partial [Methanocella sp.]